MTNSVLFTAYLEELETLQKDIEQALDGLTPAALNWTPGAEMNSIGVLVTHIAGSLSYWVGDTVGRGATHRNRAAEFRTRDVDAASLQQRLATAVADVRSTLASLSEADLADQRTAPTDGRVVTVAWALAHALAHAALHVGQVQLTRQWWEQQNEK